MGARRMVSLGGVDESALADPELRGMLMPIWQADLRAEATYIHSAEPKLTAPLRVFAAEKDWSLPVEDAHKWTKCVMPALPKILVLPGGHFFHLEGPSAPKVVAGFAADIS